jgi:predicted metal-binding protein
MAARFRAWKGVAVSKTRPILHVCSTCDAGCDLPADGVPPGKRLHDAIARLLSVQDAPVLELRGVRCLASCERGCTAAISAPGKWTYLLGRLSPAQAPDILTYGAAYAASATGTVLPTRRPASLQHAILGRFPAQEQPA